MKITKEMVNDFNKTLENLSCSFRLKLTKSIVVGNTNCEIVPSSNLFIHRATINLTDQFYAILETYFEKYGVELSYNNTRSVFWSTTGWEED